MDRGNTGINSADDTDWRDRCEYWAKYQPVKRGRKKKYAFREPLILCGHGLKISVNHDTLLIRQGRTHYPQIATDLRFFPGDPDIPDRIIILDASGAITLDALAWMSDQKIALVQLDWRGRVTFSGNSGFAPDPRLVRWQSQIQGTNKAKEINRQLIAQKLAASIETLQAIFPGLPTTELAISRIQQVALKIRKLTSSTPHQTLLGLEGAAAAEYFRAWQGKQLSWTRSSRHPIPPSWHQIGSRQMIWQKSGSNARHPLNAMLNYGYAMLISQVHQNIVMAGLDPSIGIAHRRHTNRIPLVYDLMEPMRPVVDKIVLGFILAQTFSPADFTINRLGGCRLNPNLASRLAARCVEVRPETLIDKVYLQFGQMKYNFFA